MSFFYSPDYSYDPGGGAFAPEKFSETAALLKGMRDFIEPEEAGLERLLLVHSREWVEKIFSGNLSPGEEERLELKWSSRLVCAHRRACEGTLLAARESLKNGVGVHVGGGAHHAFWDHGEGFCVFNDLAYALAVLRKEKRIRRAVVIDLDFHQGNGTAAILSAWDGFDSFSIHASGAFPFEGGTAASGTMDISLPPETGDREFHKILSESLPDFLDRFQPELALYQAGVDGFAEDSLGHWRLSAEGLRARDGFVFSEAAKRGIPVAVTLGGGYGKAAARLHAATVIEALKKIRIKQNG